MSLYIYNELNDVPKDCGNVILNNTKFFNRYSLKNDTIPQYLLQKIDRAKYHSPETIISRSESLGGLNKEYLSTGVKTILNIVYHPDLCFSLSECGLNVLREVVKLPSGRVFWENPYLYLLTDEPCDIVYKGKRYLCVYDFLDMREKEIYS